MNDKGKIIMLIAFLFALCGFLAGYLVTMLTAPKPLGKQTTYDLVCEIHKRSLSKKGRWEIYKATKKIEKAVYKELE